jgi:O-methyltransferase involved in polyketide biosynthesis
MAEIFLPLFAKGILNVPFLRRFFMKRIAPTGIYEYVLARTKLLDDIFIDALENNFSQIVLLGAGMREQRYSNSTFRPHSSPRWRY